MKEKIKCDKVYSYLVSEMSYSQIEDHLKDCASCAETLHLISGTMSLLDEEVTVPDDLVEKTVRRKTMLQVPKPSPFDYSKYLQIAAVLTAAIFLGVLLGRNANPGFLVSKKIKKDKALIEYRESLLLNNNNSFYKL